MKSKKILMIVIIIIALLAIGGASFAYLFVATDTFKSDKELFAKYISQNMEAFQEMSNLKMNEVYKNLENEEKYESNTNIKMTYSEGGEISNPINNLSAKLDIQKDSSNEYFYADGQILFDDEEYLESEIIKEKGLYGIRFSDVVSQFITIKNDQNLDKVADEIGIDSNKLITIMNIFDGTEQLSEEFIPKDEIKTLKEKYLNIVTGTISKGTFGSTKKAMITYNNNTITSNSYTVSLTDEQVRNLLVEILNNLKTEDIIVENIQDELFEDEVNQLIELVEEEEIPAVKITVYEQNKNTIRTVVEIGLDKVVIENVKENEGLKSNIQFSKITSNKTDVYDIEISKKANEDNEKLSLIANTKIGEEDSTISFLSEMQVSNNSIKSNISMTYKENILTATILLNNETNIEENFEKKETLEDKNNIVLNDIQEERRVGIIGQLKEKVPEKFLKRLKLLSQELGLQYYLEDGSLPPDSNSTGENTEGTQMTQVEVNKFNAKFEFYTGNEVSAENVKTLLGIAKDNLVSYEIISNENQESDEVIAPEDIKYSIKLNIEKDKTDEDGINPILEKIGDNEKYKVSIFYKDSNQLIDYIIIEEIKKK